MKTSSKTLTPPENTKNKLKRWQVIMMPAHECIHEEQIQGQSREIERLSERSKFKEQRIDELNDKIDKLTDKVDNISDDINKVILQSKTADKELELRLKTMETQIALQEQLIEQQKQALKDYKEEMQTAAEEAKKEADKKSNTRLVIIGLVFTAITIISNIYFNIIRL